MNSWVNESTNRPLRETLLDHICHYMKPKLRTCRGDEFHEQFQRIFQQCGHTDWTVELTFGWQDKTTTYLQIGIYQEYHYIRRSGSIRMEIWIGDAVCDYENQSGPDLCQSAKIFFTSSCRNYVLQRPLNFNVLKLLHLFLKYVVSVFSLCLCISSIICL